jgi:hypothetical protein
MHPVASFGRPAPDAVISNDRTAPLGRYTSASLASAFALALTALSGCSTTGSGPAINIPPAPSSTGKGMMDRIRAQAPKYAVEYSVAGLMKQPIGEDGAIVVGNLGRPVYYGWFSRPRAHRTFVKEVTKHGITPPTAEEFEATFDGTVFVATWSLPLIAHSGTIVHLLKGQSSSLGFSGVVTAALIGPIGDLVWASTTDQGFTVIRGVLCSATSPSYSECALQYEKGHFDRTTGRPLSRFESESSGVGIDPQTLKRRPAAPSL